MIVTLGVTIVGLAARAGLISTKLIIYDEANIRIFDNVRDFLLIFGLQEKK